MAVPPLPKVIRGISGYTKPAVFIIIVAMTTGILPAIEPTLTEASAPATTTTQALSQSIKQIVKELEYSDKIAENSAKMVNAWQDKQAVPILVTWRQKLGQAKEDCTQGKISKEQLAQTERSIAGEITYRIRKKITVNDHFFDLADVIKHKQTQCLGYSQLFYVLGTSIGLSVRAIDVIELQTPGPLPSGFGHVACIVDLADDRMIMLNLVPGGFISSPFILEEKFTKTGNYWQLKNNTNPLNIYRKIQLLDRKGLIAYIYSNRGANYSSLGRLDKAFSCYDRAVKLNPNFAMAWNNRASTHSKSGRLKPALSDYEHAIKLNPDFAEAWSNRASTYIKLNWFNQAISDCSHALKCNPHFAEAWNNRANAYAKSGQLKKALSDYNRALKCDSKLAEAYYNRGLVYGVLGQYEQAVSDCSLAIKLNPNLHKAYYNRGKVYAKLRQFNKAISDYNRAIELMPDFAKAWTNRGIAYALLGKSEVAKKDLHRVLELDPASKAYLKKVSDRFNLNLNI